jgi:hypothetical protein
MVTPSSLTKELRVAEMPWVIRAYFVLFILFVLLLVFSVSRSTPQGLSREAIEALPATKLFSIASDGIKTVLGAVLGSLSLAGEARFRKQRGRTAQRDAST